MPRLEQLKQSAELRHSWKSAPNALKRFAGLCSLLGPALITVALAVPPPPNDPWPSLAVLTSLFTLPAGQPSAERLIKELNLNATQVQELKRLAASEASYAKAGRELFGRDQATALNVRINEFKLEKDRKVRLTLGDTYPAFRTWIRAWWQEEIRKAAQTQK